MFGLPKRPVPQGIHAVGGDGDEMDGGCAYTVVVCVHGHNCTHKHLLFAVFCKLLMVGVFIVVVCVCMCAGQLSDNAILERSQDSISICRHVDLVKGLPKI